MKENKGISLVVLVVTIIIVIILAGVVILSLTQNNPINESIQASFKSELKSLDEQVVLSLSKEYVSDNSILYKKITDVNELYRLIPELKNSKYDGKIYIENGKLTINASKFKKEEIDWAIEAQIQVGNLPIIKDVKLTATETEVNVNVFTDNDVEKYMYKIIGFGTTNDWVVSDKNTNKFSNLKVGTEYIIEVKIVSSGLESISHMSKIMTLGISSLVSIVPNKTDWTNSDIIVTLSYLNIPENYELQYSIKNEEWKKYENIVTLNDNTSIKGRLYNTKLDDEIGANKVDITNIDKIPPTMPDITVVASDVNSITVKGAYSTDEQSGLEGYEYSINNGEYTTVTKENHTFAGIKAGTDVTIKARAKDNVGLYSFEKSIVCSTTNVSNSILLLADKTNWTNSNILITVSHSNIPNGYEMQHKIGNGNWTKYTDKITITDNTNITGRLYNVALDDEIGASSYDVTNIDKIPPTIPKVLAKYNNNLGANYLSGTSTKENIFVQLYSTDNLSGISYYQQSKAYTGGEDFIWEKDNYIYTAEGYRSYHYKAVDNAGNVSEWTWPDTATDWLIINIDKTAPVLGFSNGISNYTEVLLNTSYVIRNTDVVNTLAGETIATVTKTINGVKYDNDYTLPNDKVETYNIVYTMSDAAGNTSTLSRVVKKYNTYTITNVLKNSGFEDGTNNWAGYSPSYYTTTEKYSGNGSLMFLPSNNTKILTQSIPQPIKGNKYYGTRKIKTKNGAVNPADCRFEMFSSDGLDLNYVFNTNNGNYPEWTNNSGIITAGNPAIRNWIVRTFVVNQIGGELYTDDYMIINLTEAFGANNEPTKQWCDNNIKHFEGTTTIKYIK